MAINTANTVLKYATVVSTQIETATVVGTITLGGNATVTVTGKGIVGSPLAVSVAVLLGDDASDIAGKIITALNALSAITAIYTVDGTGADVVLTRTVPDENDTTLNIAVANGNCEGITEDASSTNTQVGCTHEKLVDIISYPDLGSAPSKLDTTTLSATQYKTSILGLQEVPDLAFECLYDDTAYVTISALTTSQYFKLCFNDETDGAFSWMGNIGIYASGGGVDEVRKMQIVLSAETPIIYS